MELKDALKKLPTQPGIYFMKDSLGYVIYVGKAKNLKARVSQYFRQNKNHSDKIKEMVQQIDTFDYTITDTELEAFLLECKTIKELQPKYNRLLKNYKAYKYIKLSIYENYPKLSMVTQQKKDGSLYFGPFSSQGSVENTIEFIKDNYLIRKCSSNTFNKISSGCLNYQLGKCLAPCRDIDVTQEYCNQIDRIVQLLKGDDYSPIKLLNSNMKLAAENLDFEKAVKFRDQLRGIRHVLNKQKIIKISRYGRNILAAEKCGESEIKLFLIKGNKLLHIEMINFSQYDSNALEEKLRNLIVTSFKSSRSDKEWILSQEDIDEAQIIFSYLRNKNNGIKSFKIPVSRINQLNYSRIVESLYGDFIHRE